MLNNSSKMFCVIAFVLTASGCGSGGSDETNDSLVVPTTTDPLIVVDDLTSTDNTATTGDIAVSEEMIVSNETSDGLAVPVASVSSAQMDDFVENPLVSMSPTELGDENSGGVSRSFITNPLIN